MATKVKTQTSKPTSTPASTTIQTQTSWWSSTSSDQLEISNEDSFSHSKSSTASSPPPEVQLKKAQNSYNFNDIAISKFVPATIQRSTQKNLIQRDYEDEGITLKPLAEQVLQRDYEDEGITLKPLAEQTIQRDYEDEGITLKPLAEQTIQRDYEDEGITLKPLAEQTIQRDYEDEGITLKPLAEQVLQRDYEDEGITLKPLAEQVLQRDYEDEGITLKPLAEQVLQRDYEDEGITLKPLAKDITGYQQPAVKKINRSLKSDDNNLMPDMVQTKMVVGAPDDKYEKEADSMADKVMKMTTAPIQTSREETPIQRVCENCEEEAIATKPLAEPTIQRDYEDEGITLKPLAEQVLQRDYEDEGITLKPLAEQTIQRDYEDEGITLKPLAEPRIQRDTDTDSGVINPKPLAKNITPYKRPTVKKINRDVNLSSNDGAFQASSNVESSLKASKGGGKKLPDSTRGFMENRFGNDFSQVKVHTGHTATQMNKNLQAKAFTHGNDVYFNSGQYNPHSTSGKTLIAHELTHTIQQTGASPLQTKKTR